VTRTLSLLFALAALAAPVLADDEDDGGGGGGAAEAIKLAGTIGLTGFRDMVDARVPDGLSIRGGIRYDLLVVDQDFSGAVRATRKADRHEFTLYGGASLLGLIDAAARIPYLYTDDEINRRGLVDRDADEDIGWGDFDLAAKVALEVGPLDVAPFVFGRFPTGEPDVRDLAEFHYGAAATFSFFGDFIAAHANLAGVQIEEGLSAFRYRFGVSLVGVATSALLVRVYGYLDGVEFEGRADSDIDLELGAQAILFELITVEVGASTRLLDSGFLDDSAKEALAGQNVFDRHFDDDGTWQLQVGVGVVF